MAKVKNFVSSQVEQPYVRSRQPRSHDFYPGNTEVPLGDNKDTIWNDPEEWSYNYTPQTDEYRNSIPSSFPNPRGLTEEQLFQLMKKNRGMDRQQFEKVYKEMKGNRYASALLNAFEADQKIIQLVKGKK